LEKIMAEKKKAVKKEVKEYWKITAPGWIKPVLRPKYATSDRVLKSIKAKKGYIVEEA
tara:strand:- start:429 stop:602 length:174 start_codon:yes stop_codon:yes gene_type:complete